MTEKEIFGPGFNSEPIGGPGWPFKRPKKKTVIGIIKFICWVIIMVGIVRGGIYIDKYHDLIEFTEKTLIDRDEARMAAEYYAKYSMSDTIKCLEKYESGENEMATGAAGEKGCMQFMPETFEIYCVGRYEFPDDIWNCEIQKACAKEMITDGGIRHWTTAKYCR